MGNTTLVAQKQWNCSLKTSVHPLVRTQWTTSPSFTIKGLPEPSFKISACFTNSKTFSVKLQLLKSGSERRWKTSLAEINLDVYGLVERREGMPCRKIQRIFNLTKQSGLIDWNEDKDRHFIFDNFPMTAPQTLFQIYIKYIRCEIIWHGPILKMPEVNISMYDMKSFLMNPEFTDITLKIDDEELRVHKIVLASQSPVFAAMFTTPMRESIENTVHIQNTNIETVRIILRYLYTGHCTNLNDPGTLWEIFNFARMYEMKELKGICERKLMKNLRIEDVTGLLDTLDDNSKMLYEVMSEHDFVIGKKAPEYPVEFSELMNRVFNNRHHIQSDEIELIKIALMFWYIGESKEFLKPNCLWKSYFMTKNHGLTNCRDFCEGKLLDALNFENVVSMMDLADDCQSKVVYWRALHIAAERRAEVSVREDFKELCHRKTKIGVEFLEYCRTQKVPEEKNHKKKTSSRPHEKPNEKQRQRTHPDLATHVY